MIFSARYLRNELFERPLFRQTWAMSAIFFCVISTGISHHPLTAEELHTEQGVSHLEYYNIATTVGYVTSAILMDQVGRRLTFILATLPGFISCFLVYLPPSNTGNILRVLFNGLSSGLTIILGVVIIGEYTSPKYRGIFLNLVTTSMNIGRTVGLILRASHWKWVLTSFVLQIVSFGIATTWPESPYWLESKKKYQKSETAFQWLRNTTCKKELEDLKLKRGSNISINCSFKTAANLWKILNDFLGLITIVAFGVILIETSEIQKTAPSLAIIQTLGVAQHTFQVLTGGIETITSIVLLCLLLLLRHRTLLLISGCISALTLCLFSVFIFLNSYNLMSNNYPWLGYLLFLLQLIFSNLGSTSIPLALIGEIFPIRYKTAGCIISGVIMSVISWVVLRTMPYLLSVVHLQGVLILYGLFMTLSILVLIFILPETKNKTLLEIEDHFKNEYSTDNNSQDDKVRLTI